MDARQETKSLKKALRVLKVMNEKGDATVSDISAAIGVPRTTAYRLLETFATEGYVERQPHSLYYRLTSKVLQLGFDLHDVNVPLKIAGPLMSACGASAGRPVSPAGLRAAALVTCVSTNHDSACSRGRAANRLAAPVLTATGSCRSALHSEFERENVIGMVRASGDPLRSLTHEK